MRRGIVRRRCAFTKSKKFLYMLPLFSLCEISIITGFASRRRHKHIYNDSLLVDRMVGPLISEVSVFITWLWFIFFLIHTLLTGRLPLKVPLHGPYLVREKPRSFWKKYNPLNRKVSIRCRDDSIVSTILQLFSQIGVTRGIHGRNTFPSEK